MAFFIPQLVFTRREDLARYPRDLARDQAMLEAEGVHYLFAPGVSEDKVMDAAIEAGAEDVAANDDGSIEVLTAPNDFVAVKDALEAAGFKPEFGEVTMKPEGENVFTGDDAVKMQKLLDALENLDDVQEIYTTAVIDE